jgi:hypothetical protein
MSIIKQMRELLEGLEDSTEVPASEIKVKDTIVVNDISVVVTSVEPAKHNMIRIRFDKLGPGSGTPRGVGNKPLYALTYAPTALILRQR